MKKCTSFFIFCLIVILSACKKEDAVMTVHFSALANPLTYKSTHTELLLWISGEQVNTEGLSYNDILQGDIENSYPYTQHIFTFFPDSVEFQLNDSTAKAAYHFSNDSLYITLRNPYYELSGPPFVDKYYGQGSPSAFIWERSTIYIRRNNQKRTISTSGNYSFGTVGDINLFSDPSEMNEGDTVMIYNRQYFFN